MRLIKTLPQVTSLSLNRCDFFGNTSLFEFSRSAGSAHLLSLNLAGCGQLTESAFFSPNSEGVSLFPSLTSLNVRECSHINGNGYFSRHFNCVAKAIESLATCRPHGLINLSVAKCNQLPTSSLVAMVTHNGATLLSLDLSYYLALDNDMLSYVGKMCRNLDEISLDGCFKISSAGIVALKGCKNLKKISLSGCPGIDHSGLCEAIESLPWVQDLDLSDCRQINNHTLRSIALQTKKNLKKLSLRGLRILRKMTNM